VNPKYLETLELNKILEQLAEHTSFSAGRELALALQPSADAEEVRLRQQETAEAKMLLSVQPGLSIGGAHDVRSLIKNAEIGATLEPSSLLDIQSTLLSGRKLRRAILSVRERFPTLAGIVQHVEECPELVAEIGRCINDRGEVMDSASPALARIRRELSIARDRLLDRLNRLIASPSSANYLQEALITQRGGRYVVPLKVESKGRIPGIVHDQSSSGATLFIEPLAAVELGNQLRQLQLDEQREIERILYELTVAVSEHAGGIQATVEALAALDLAFCKARYAFQIKAVEPSLLQGSAASGDAPFPPYLRLVRARHPLLPPDTVVPIDVHLGGDFAALVVTGPNTGGKTVALKTVGLLAAMAQCGLQIPAAEGSSQRVFSGLYADIGDEQSIEQSLSTFSSHMNNIVSILAEADEHSLVLLDELGAGTDPTEGSALGRAILMELLGRRIPSMVTTHYKELKLFAQATEGVENASVEFDVQTLAPTYRLQVGLPGRSNAFAIAQRLGLPQRIIGEAKQWISDEDVKADEILERIRRSRRELGRATHAAQASLSEARRKEKEARRVLRETERDRRELLEEARALLQEAQEEMRRIREAVDRRKVTERWLEEAAERVERLVDQQESIEPSPTAAPRSTVSFQEPLAVGDTVWISSLDQTGQILSLGDEEAEVQVGVFRAKVPLLELEKRQPAPSAMERDAVRIELSSRPMPTVELSLRGLRVEEALTRLGKYLDSAYLASLPYARIIHGKGTGALREAVRQVLAEHPLVASFRSGELNEGGDGVTIVKFLPREG
jgi:DNA mismatch repair protein MutS2